MSIRTLLTDDHRQCDALFAETEQAVMQRDLAVAQASFATFRRAMLAHFEAEEHTLFPAFENRTGMTQGPTQVMRMEHAQMRRLLDDAVNLLLSGKTEAYFELAETLLIMIQQHNMKEENVLYPMCDQHLGDDVTALTECLKNELSLV